VSNSVWFGHLDGHGTICLCDVATRYPNLVRLLLLMRVCLPHRLQQMLLYLMQLRESWMLLLRDHLFGMILRSKILSMLPMLLLSF
jgi:hypothetical protein